MSAQLEVSIMVSLGSKLIRWLQENLFRSWLDGLVTIVLAGMAVWLLAGFVEWALIRADWSTNSRDECQQIVASLCRFIIW